MALKVKVQSLVVCALLPFALLACGGSGGDEPAPMVKAFGKAHLSAPLVGASVEVFDAGGRHVGTLEHTTDAGGIFDVELPAGKASRFRLVVTGGTHDGQPFTDRLLLDAEGFNASREPLYANAATTLISRYIDRHPGTAIGQATDRVKAFLKIPAHASPGFSVDNPHQNYFRHERLLAAMQASGTAGLVPFLDGLVAQMDAGVASHTFARAPMLRGAFGDNIFSKFLAFLGHALADEGLGLAFETVMTELGLDGTAEILRELHEINHKLDELKELTTEVLAETKDIELQALTLALDADVTIIQTLYKNLTTVAQTSLPACGSGDAACEALQQARLRDRQKVVRGYMNEILNGVSGSTSVAKKLDNIAGKLDVVTATEPGLLGRASEFLKMSRHFDSAVTDPRLVATKEYYQTVQAMGMHLVVEALMAQQSDSTSAVDQRVFRERMKKEAHEAIDNFNARLKQQDARVEALRFKNEDVVEQLRTNLVWMRAPISNLKKPHYESSCNIGGCGGDWEDIWPVEANRLCRILKDEHFAGYSGWRLPTESEFHKFVKGSPNDSGNADGGRGIFDWLVAQGFQRAPGNGQLFQRGILVDEKMKTAYFTSTPVIGGYHEALWDYGVDSAADIPEHRTGHYIPSIAGAWCVTQKAAGH